MEFSLADQYYLKAHDNYPYELEVAIEQLNYALSYDDKHAPANCMMGKIYMFQLKDYKKASECFYNALLGDLNYPDTYKYYSLLRAWEGEYERAFKIIARGLAVKGMDKASLLLIKANIHEWKMEFIAARKVLKQAKLIATDKCKIDYIDSSLSRLKKKMKLTKADKPI